MKKFGLLFVLLSALMCSNAFAIEFKALGGVSLMKPYESGGPGISFSNKTGTAFGAAVGFRLAPVLGLELGAMYDMRKFDAKLAGIETITKQNYLEIPLMLRVNLPFISFGAGPYYATALGDVNAAEVAPDGTVGPYVSSTYAQELRKKSEFGFVGSVALKFHLAPTVSFLVDGRYLQSINNFNDDPADRDTVTDTWKGFQLLGGLSFGI